MSDPNDEAARIALGHLVNELAGGVLSQGFTWERGWIINLLQEAGLMRGDASPSCSWTPLAEDSIALYLANLPPDPDER
jgi:hypothetical protein